MDLSQAQERMEWKESQINRNVLTREHSHREDHCYILEEKHLLNCQADPTVNRHEQHLPGRELQFNQCGVGLPASPPKKN